MLDYATKADIPALKALWKGRFYDTDSYINNYFNSLFNMARMPIYRAEDGTPVSMLSMLPVSLQCGARWHRGHYIYAAATRADYEGQGLMSRLLEFACRDAAAQGEEFSCLLPATEALVCFYRKRGYRPAFFKELVHYPPYGAAAPQQAPCFRLLEGEEFAALRKRFVSGLDAVLLQDSRLYPYIHLELTESGLETLGLSLDGREHYLVCDPAQGMLVIKETSLSREQLAGCVDGLKERYGCDSVVAAFPSEGECGVSLNGLLRFLGGEFSIGRAAYAGLLMD